MKKIFLIGLISCLFSCHSYHENTIDSSFRIGNVYCSDGSVIEPFAYDDANKKAVGIVFWVNESGEQGENKALVVSLEDLPSASWSDSLAYISYVSTDTQLLNGANNTASTILWGDDEEVGTDASIMAYLYYKYGVGGWHLPSTGEAMLINDSYAEIQHTLELLNADAFDDKWYWTSTQDGTGQNTPVLNAISISLSQGVYIGTGKFNKFAIRPIIAIK